jgi:hypothetical protein
MKVFLVFNVGFISLCGYTIYIELNSYRPGSSALWRKETGQPGLLISPGEIPSSFSQILKQCYVLLRIRIHTHRFGIPDPHQSEKRDPYHGQKQNPDQYLHKIKKSGPVNCGGSQRKNGKYR